MPEIVWSKVDYDFNPTCCNLLKQHSLENDVLANGPEAWVYHFTSVGPTLQPVQGSFAGTALLYVNPILPDD